MKIHINKEYSIDEMLNPSEGQLDTIAEFACDSYDAFYKAGVNLSGDVSRTIDSDNFWITITPCKVTVDEVTANNFVYYMDEMFDAYPKFIVAGVGLEPVLVYE